MIMNEINWVQATETIHEAFDEGVMIGMVELWNTDWHWRMLNVGEYEDQVRGGKEYSSQDAMRRVEECRSDQFALSGRGILRWSCVAKDDWIAFSGDLQVGSVSRICDEIRVIRRFHAEDGTAQDVREGRRMVEEWWGDHLRIAGLVPRHLAGAK